MDRQNVTLSLPRSLLRRAKAVAANSEKSLSEFLKESLKEKIDENGGYQRAKERHIKVLNMNYNLGTHGKIPVTREKLHDRK
ncbi:MAG: CopG family transcriptional regulator [bacterium]